MPASVVASVALPCLRLVHGLKHPGMAHRLPAFGPPEWETLIVSA